VIHLICEKNCHSLKTNEQRLSTSGFIEVGDIPVKEELCFSDVNCGIPSICHRRLLANIK